MPSYDITPKAPTDTDLVSTGLDAVMELHKAGKTKEAAKLAEAIKRHVRATR